MNVSSQSSPSTDLSWGIVVQARMGSTRLPGKMLDEVVPGRSLLSVVLGRLLSVVDPGRIVLATTTHAQDDPLVALAQAEGVTVYRGSEHDVLDRFREAARVKGWRYIVRVCADNPLVQADRIAPLVSAGLAAEADYCAYFFNDGLPSIRSHCGLFAEWVSVAALDRVALLAPASEYREHVTNYIYGHPAQFHLVRLPVPNEPDVRNWRMTIDTRSDLDLCRSILEGLGDGGSDLDRLRSYIAEHPALLEVMRTNMRDNAK